MIKKSVVDIVVEYARDAELAGGKSKDLETAISVLKEAEEVLRKHFVELTPDARAIFDKTFSIDDISVLERFAFGEI